MNSFYLRIKPSETTKIVISVSKKVSKKAVTRNLVKRRVRAVMRNYINNIKPGTYMIVAKPGADKVKGEDLRSELAELFKKG